MNSKTASSDLAAQLAGLLSVRGLQTSAQLQSATRKSQAAVSRALSLLQGNAADDLGLLDAPRVAVLGRARATRYALVRSILGRWPGQQSVFLTDPVGHIQRWGSLHFLAGQQVLVRSLPEFGAHESLTQGALPWFMAALKPQGFMARLSGERLGYANTHPDEWSLEQILNALLGEHQDAPGALSLGDLRGELLPEVPLEPAQRALVYDDLARGLGQNRPAGSSAGGEQPKFVTHLASPVGYERLIVKFTPPRGTPFGERWHDLLHAECLALHTLAEAGLAAASTRILRSDQRTYLESVRFDRVGSHGKQHLVPLWAVHRQWVGGPQQDWAATCDALAQRGLLSQADAECVRLLLYFGRLIGNTDMHFGNLSLLVADMGQLDAPHFLLAPVYDMLPMRWRPDKFQGAPDYAPFSSPPAPLGSDAIWPKAMRLARHFWCELAACAQVSLEIRQAAQAQSEQIQAA
jgi:HipA-like C-terminal domain